MLTCWIGMMIWVASVAAEYRVFKLRISNAEGTEQRFEKTVLDDLQYPMYYPVNKGEKVEIWETWKCMGRTAPGRDFCPGPSENNDEPTDDQPAA